MSLTLALLGTLLVLSAQAANPIKFGTLDITFSPESALTILEAEKQMFRAPLCDGQMLDNWEMTAKVYVQNVPWDSMEIGDDNWLRIRVSNKADMSNIIADNDKSRGPEIVPFRYNKETWGGSDIFIEITASMGSPSFQYGLELRAHEGPHSYLVPDGMDTAQQVEPMTEVLEIETMEQLAVPYTDSILSTKTAQYKIPFCFEDVTSSRTIPITTLALGDSTEAPGGVATYVCTTPMMYSGICYRAKVTKRGDSFFDPAGNKVAAQSPTIVKEEYGPVYLLVLAQGNANMEVKYTITTKLRNPSETALRLTGEASSDIHNIVSLLVTNLAAAPAPDHEVPEDKDEL